MSETALLGPWVRRFGDPSDAFASGWMQLRGARRRRGVDRGFVLSDHADWPGLLQAIEATGAQRVIVTHGSSAAMVRYLTERRLQAESFETEFGDDAVVFSRLFPLWPVTGIRDADEGTA